MNEATIDVSKALQVAQAAVLVPLEQIDPNPYQVRLSEDPEAVQAIAASIEQSGLLQTPVARLVAAHAATTGDAGMTPARGGERYELAFGHTRYAAFTALLGQGKTQYGSMPLVVRELTDAQLFEMAVAENVQRRDLTPIEEAQAMRRALDEFGYTSAQVGELFGVSAETVRGKVRLLALPKAVQDMVQSGEINEGVSRALISAGKVMEPKKLAETARMIASGMYDVEEAGEALVQGLRLELHEMWGKYSRGEGEGEEPRGGYGLWPLTWKHTGLPPMTPAAVAHTLKLKEKPEQIAGLVEALNAGMEFPGAESDDPEALQKIQVLVNPPACTDCPMYVRLNGSHFCGLKPCWERKQRAWSQTEFNRVARELEIPVYANEKTDGKFRTHNWDTRKEFIGLMKTKDPDLRLVFKPKSQIQDECTGSHFAELVDVNAKRVAAAERKHQVPRSVSKPMSVEEREKQNAEQRRLEKLQEAAEKFAEGVAPPVFAQAFKPLTNAAVLRMLCQRSSELFGFNPRKDKKATVADLREILAKALLTEDVGEPVIDYGDLQQGPVYVAKLLQGVAKEWGVKLPADWMARAKGMMPVEDKSLNTKVTKATKGSRKAKKGGK